MVAVTVVVLSVFTGLCNIKDGNLVQAMQQAQADRLDHWNFYQARNVRQEVAAAAVTQLTLAAAGAPGAQQEGYRAAIASYEAIVADQVKKKEELRLQADQDQRTYDALNYRDDQFDLSDTLIALAISLVSLGGSATVIYWFPAGQQPTPTSVEWIRNTLAEVVLVVMAAVVIVRQYRRRATRSSIALAIVGLNAAAAVYLMTPAFAVLQTQSLFSKNAALSSGVTLSMKPGESSPTPGGAINGLSRMKRLRSDAFSIAISLLAGSV